jgi:thiol-disulfide isomerase/thioredoxin
VVSAGALLSACSNGVGTSGGTGYVSGKGAVTSLPASDRKPVGPLEGTTIDGRAVSLHDYAGQVVVVNVWGSWCAPCRAEAPALVAASKQLAGKDVAFLGINSRDLNRAAARAFVRRFHVPYPSIYDQQGKTLLAFHATLTPNSIPSTVVVDRKGRVAASILGEITARTLVDLVEDVEKAPSAGSVGRS